MGLVQSAAAYGVGKIMDKLYDDPETNMRKMMDLADKIAGNGFPGQRKAIDRKSVV